MPVQVDFSLVQYSDGLLTVGMSPPVAIGGWPIRFQVLKRFESDSPLITKSCASGFAAGQSGIAVVNSGQGIINITIDSVNTSGWDSGSYVYELDRLSSGARTRLAEGFFSLLP